MGGKGSERVNDGKEEKDGREEGGCGPSFNRRSSSDNKKQDV